MTELCLKLINSNSFEEYSKNLSFIRENENNYRKIYCNPALDPTNECLKDPLCNLVPVHKNSELFKYRDLFPEEKEIPRIFQLEKRRKVSDACIATADEFKTNFDVLTEGMLKYIDWNNIIVAGGSVSACLRPVPNQNKTTRKKLRDYFHVKEYSGVDIDLFIYGLDEEGAK